MTSRDLLHAGAIFPLVYQSLGTLRIGKLYPGLGHCSERVLCTYVGGFLRKPRALKRTLEVLLGIIGHGCLTVIITGVRNNAIRACGLPGEAFL